MMYLRILMYYVILRIAMLIIIFTISEDFIIHITVYKYGYLFILVKY